MNGRSISNSQLAVSFFVAGGGPFGKKYLLGTHRPIHAVSIVNMFARET